MMGCAGMLVATRSEPFANDPVEVPSASCLHKPRFTALTPAPYHYTLFGSIVYNNSISSIFNVYHNV